MVKNAILVSIVALFAIVLTLSAVAAVDFVSIDKVEVNGVTLNSGLTYVGQVSNTVPIEIQFSGLQDVSERVKVKAVIEGFKDDIEQSEWLGIPINTGVHGYVSRLSLKLPSAMDIEDLSEDVTLEIRVSTKDQDTVIATYKIKMERDLYNINFLQVDAPDKVNVGTTVPINVVLQNNGNERLDNLFVKVSVPELGIERKIFVGDLGPNPESDDDYYENIKDVVERTILLPIPRNAVPGTYNIEVEAYNYDTSTTAKEKIVVSGMDSGVVPGTSAKTVSIGEEATFDLTLVNPNDQMVVYSITPETASGLTVVVDPALVTVPAQSSKTVKVSVKPTSSAEEGTHTVLVNVNSDSGLVKQATYSVNVQKKASTPTSPGSAFTANGVLILTVILVIIFVVLLVVLIVLLTRKPAETEEFGETSYY